MRSNSAFHSIDHIFSSIVQDIGYRIPESPTERWQEVPSRNGATIEMLGFSAKFEPNRHNVFLRDECRRLSPRYACAELLWYLLGDNRVEMIAHYAPQYKKFAENEYLVYGGYPERLNLLGDGLRGLQNALTLDEYNRRAVLSAWDRQDVWEQDKKDLPCTLTLQFLLRGTRLHCITTMRSNDVWLGLPYDIFAFTFIQRMLAAAMGVMIGSYTHQAGSLHVYKKDYDRLYYTEPAREQDEDTQESFSLREQERCISQFGELEKKLRIGYMEAEDVVREVKRLLPSVCFLRDLMLGLCLHPIESDYFFTGLAKGVTRACSSSKDVI